MTDTTTLAGTDVPVVDSKVRDTFTGDVVTVTGHKVVDVGDTFQEVYVQVHGDDVGTGTRNVADIELIDD